MSKMFHDTHILQLENATIILWYYKTMSVRDVELIFCQLAPLWPLHLLLSCVYTLKQILCQEPVVFMTADGKSI